MNDEYGEPETDVDAAILDETLREMFNDISPESPLPAADAIAAIREAIDEGWPDGSPPPAEELDAEHSGDSFDPLDHSDPSDLSDHWFDTPVGDSHFDSTHDHGGDFDHDAG